jgi:hypothetical protein
LGEDYAGLFISYRLVEPLAYTKPMQAVPGRRREMPGKRRAVSLPLGAGE